MRDETATTLPIHTHIYIHFAFACIRRFVRFASIFLFIYPRVWLKFVSLFVCNFSFSISYVFLSLSTTTAATTTNTRVITIIMRIKHTRFTAHTNHHHHRQQQQQQQHEKEHEKR